MWMAVTARTSTPTPSAMRTYSVRALIGDTQPTFRVRIFSLTSEAKRRTESKGLGHSMVMILNTPKIWTMVNT